MRRHRGDTEATAAASPAARLAVAAVGAADEGSMTAAGAAKAMRTTRPAAPHFLSEEALLQQRPTTAPKGEPRQCLLVLL